MFWWTLLFGINAYLHSIPTSKCNHTIRVYNAILYRVVLPHSLTWFCSTFFLAVLSLPFWIVRISWVTVWSKQHFICFDFQEKGMSLITKVVAQISIKTPVNIKISTKFIPSFEVIVVSLEVQKKFGTGTVVTPVVRSVVLQKSVVEISEVRSRNFRNVQKIRKKCSLVFYFRSAHWQVKSVHWSVDF